jgi:hypothetical protein
MLEGLGRANAGKPFSFPAARIQAGSRTKRYQANMVVPIIPMLKEETNPVGRPAKPEAERASAHIQLRVRRDRKTAYVRASKGKGLAKWCFEHLDKASGYKEPER